MKDAIRGAAGPGESAEGEIRGGGGGVGWGGRLLQRLGLREKAEVIHCSAVKAGGDYPQPGWQ